MGRHKLSLFFVSFLVVAVAVFTGACSDDEPKRPPVYNGGPSGPVSGGSMPAFDGGISEAGLGTDAGTCTDLVNAGVAVDQQAVADELVAGTGGTVSDGSYNLTEAKIYVGVAGTPGPTNTTYRETIRIAAPTYERVLVFTSSGGTSSEIRSSGTFTQTGSTGSISLTCPSVNTEQVTFSATAQTLTVSNIVTKESFTYVLQP